MHLGEADRRAREKIRDELASLQGRFEDALDRFEPGCDADAVAAKAREIRAGATDVAGTIEDLQEFLAGRLADARGLEEKADRLADDAHSRYYGPEGAGVQMKRFGRIEEEARLEVEEAAADPPRGR